MMLDVILDRESSAQQNCPSLFLHNLTYIHDNRVIM